MVPKEFRIGTSFAIAGNEYVVVNKRIDRITFKHYYSDFEGEQVELIRRKQMPILVDNGTHLMTTMFVEINSIKLYAIEFN